MTDLLPNYVGGAWVDGAGRRDDLARSGDRRRPGSRVQRRSRSGERFRVRAGAPAAAALRALTLGQRAAMLGDIVKMLQANRDAYFDIAIANSGTTRGDSAIDIDGSIYTLGQFARWGAALGDDARSRRGRAKQARQGRRRFNATRALADARGGAPDQRFQLPGLGPLGEGGAALLSGVPVIVKPATATAWLAQRMVADVVAAADPARRSSLDRLRWFNAGSSISLQPFDVVSFTGSGATASEIRSHRRDGERLGARERRGRQPELRAPDAGRRCGSLAFGLARARGRPRDDDQVGPEMHGDPAGAGSRTAVPAAADAIAASSRASPSATRATTRSGWARSSAARSSTSHGGHRQLCSEAE